MRLLLDTHVFIWWVQGATQLSPRVLSALSDPANEIFLSVASIWEAQVKLQLGKLALGQPLRQTVEYEVESMQLQLLPLVSAHVFALESLALHHRDPFDRMLAAQSIVEGLTLITKDAIFANYGVTTLW